MAKSTTSASASPCKPKEYSPAITGIWEIAISDEGDGTLKAKAQELGAYPVDFENTYDVTSVNVKLPMDTKVVTASTANKVVKASDFAFNLYKGDKAEGDPVQTASVTGDGLTGEAQFGDLTFTKDDLQGKTENTLKYSVKEQIPTDGKSGVTYDTHIGVITVTIRDNGSGQLEATATTDTDTLKFTNKYDVTPVKINLKASKTFNNGANASVGIQDVWQDKVVSNDSNGNAAFEALSFPIAGTYSYTVYENDVTDKPGVSKDSSVYTVTYSVVDAGNSGQLQVTSKTIEKSGKEVKSIAFESTYSPGSVTYALGGRKVLQNNGGTTRKLKAGELIFALKGINGVGIDGTKLIVPMPDTTEVKNDANGNFQCGEMLYGAPGIYTYQITEKNNGEEGIQYDDTVYTVKVVVTDDGSGRLQAASDKKAADVVFTNTYTPQSAVAELSLTKSLDGRTIKNGEFLFDLKSEDGNVLQTARITSTSREEGLGKAEFKNLAFDKVGTYTYTVQEQDTKNGGVAFDTTPRIAVIDVTEDKDNNLASSVKYYKDSKETESLDFTNGYSATPVSVKLQAKKMLEGKSLTEGEFNFQLLNDKSEVTDTASNMQDGLISFKDIEYKSAGKYDYVIKEIKGNEKGVTYDTSEKKVEVAVSDNQNGALVAEVNYDGVKKDGDVPVFTNKFTPETLKPETPQPETPKPETPKPSTPVEVVKKVLASTGSSIVIIMIAAIALLIVGGAVLLGKRRTTTSGRHSK